MAEEKVYDSPKNWVRRHISDYVRTGGAKGHRWHGVDSSSPPAADGRGSCDGPH
jgi:hypothetical protein